jgi:hypothetical protein
MLMICVERFVRMKASTDSEKSEEEQLTELRDTLQKAKRDLRSPSIDPETLRW